MSHLDSETAVAGDVEPVPCELVRAVIPLDQGLGRAEGLAGQADLAAGHRPHHGLRGRRDLGGQRQHVDEHVLVHVAVHPLRGRVAPVVSGVLLGQVRDDDGVGGYGPPGVEGGLEENTVDTGLTGNGITCSMGLPLWTHLIWGAG